MAQNPFAHLILALFTLNWSSVQAEILPLFNLDSHVRDSKLVIRGECNSDSRISISKVLKGEIEVSGDQQISVENLSFDLLKNETRSKKKIEVVIFLGERVNNNYRMAEPYTSYVAFSPGGSVYAVLSSYHRGGAKFRKHSTWKKLDFMSALTRSISLDEQLTEILSKERNPERLEISLDFLLRNIQKNSDFYHYRRWRVPTGYGRYFREIANSIIIPTPDEEAVLAAALRKAEAYEDRLRILTLINCTKLSPNFFPELIPWIGPDKPLEVRKLASSSLAKINPFRTSGELAEFLSFKDPHFEGVIHSINNCHRNYEEFPLNRKVVDQMIKLCEILSKEEEHEHGTAEFLNSKSQYRQQLWQGLKAYFHPALVPAMLKFIDKDDKYKSKRLSNLRSALGLEEEPENLKKWWNENHSVISRDYNFSSSKGISDWLSAYEQNEDTVLRRNLLLLWDFEPDIPEQELLQQCSGDQSDTAKFLVSEL